MTSAIIEEMLADIRTALKLLGLKTHIELDITHQRGCPWTLRRSGQELWLWCHNSAVLDQVVAAVKDWGHTVEPGTRADTVIITPATS